MKLHMPYHTMVINILIIDILTKLHVHYHVMVIYTRNKIHEIKSIAYLVMVEDGINYLNSSNQRAITPL